VPTAPPDIPRWVRLATTWVAKATAALDERRAGSSSEERKWAVGFYAEQLLAGVLDDAERLAKMVNDDSLGEVAPAAAALAARLRARRLAFKLENVEGRTPEEAQAFRARAEELRSR
jgi:hypothetical protein